MSITQPAIFYFPISAIFSLTLGYISMALMMSGCSDERLTNHHVGSGELSGKTIAILAVDGFEQSELLKPRKALDAVGACTVVVSSKAGTITGWNNSNWGTKVAVDITLADARAWDYDALVLPGGVMNPDQLRMNPAACAFAKSFVDSGKPIAAICHGPWLLVEVGGIKGHHVTSWPSLRTDLTNAGGTWEDKPVVVDRMLVTSRKPEDIPDFNREMITLIISTKTLGH